MTGDFERTSYLGYPIIVGTEAVTVFTPASRKIATVRSVKTARLVVRGYRKAERTFAPEISQAEKTGVAQ